MKTMRISIILLILSFITGIASADPLLYESFEEEWNTSSPWGPVGWSEADADGVCNTSWMRHGYDWATEGSYVAYIYKADDDDPGISYLITPSLDLTSTSRPDFMEYYLKFRLPLTGSDKFYIMVSTDDCASWDIIKTYDNTNTTSLAGTFLTRQVIDLSAYDDQSNVKIGFCLDFNASNSETVRIDCVMVDEYDPSTTFEGTVTDSNLNPLDSVRVCLDNGYFDPVYIYTDTNGFYSDSFVIGTYSVEYYKEGYATEVYENVVMDSGATTVLDVVLGNTTMELNPTSIDETVPFAGTSSSIISITNSGDVPLEWSARLSDPSKQQNALYNRGSIAYGYENVTYNGIVSVNIDNGVYTTLFETPETWAGDFGIESPDSMYFYNLDNGKLCCADINTGEYITIGSVGSGGMYDMACDRTTGIMYGVYSNKIYTIDLSTGAATLVGAVGNTGGKIYGLAIDGNGDMWAIDVDRDEIWSIDKETGQGAVVGQTGIECFCMNSMAWDPVTDCIYLATNIDYIFYRYYIYTVDTSTGNVNQITGSIYGQLDILAFPGDGCPLWTSLSAYNGTVQPGETMQDTIYYYALEDSVGAIHTCDIIFESNDTDVVTVPLTLTVGEGEYGVLTGTVTSTNDNTPIDNALITVTNETKFTWTAYTNSSGVYTIDNIIGGTFTVECTAIGYNPATDNTTVVAFQTTTLDISLDSPIMTVTPTLITEQVPPYSPLDVDIAIGNTEGSGELTWTAEIADRSPRKKLSLPPVSDNYPRGYQTDDAFYELAPTDMQPLYGKDKSEFTPPKGSIGYGFETSNGVWVSIDTDMPDSLTTIFSGSFQTSAGAFGIDIEDHMYCFNNSGYTLCYVDLTDGSYTTIGSTGLDMLADMACDKTTGIMYALYTNNCLYTVDLTTGECTLIGDTGGSAMAAIAVDGEGNMWGHDIALDEIWSIDKETAAGTSVGSTGFDAYYLQSMAWDPLTNIVYLAAFNVGNFSYQLRAVDTSTGATSLLGGVSGEEVAVLSFPGDGTIPWITLDPEVDIVPAGESSTLTATFNTISHSYGEELSCNILLHSDPDMGTVTIPVTVIVEEDSYGTLTGTVTSGDNGLPLEGALITATNENRETYSASTNSSGIYTIDDIIVTTYTVECVADGYNTATEEADIYAGQTTTLDFGLTAPIMTVTPDNITEGIAQSSSMQVEITIDNTEGSGELNWTAEIANQVPKELSLPAATDDFPRGTNEVSCGIAPMDLVPAYGENEPEFSPLSGSIGYGYEAVYSKMVSIDTEDATLTTLFSSSFVSYAGEFGIESEEYMYLCNNTTQNLVYYNITDGTSTPIGNLGVEYLLDMACDKSTGIMYGVYNNILYTVDLTTGSCSSVGNIGSNAMLSLAVDRESNMWGIDIGSDELWSIDKETGQGTAVGSIGFDANYAQSMAWDPETDMVYLAAFNNSNNWCELRAVDTSSGNTTLIGGSYQKQVTILSFPGTSPWITLDPEFGVTPAGESSTLTATLSTYGYDFGETLVCNIVINSDPDVGTATIPVVVNVLEAERGALTGTIISTNDNTPLEGVLVTATDNSIEDYSTYTDAYGSYTIEDMIVGTYTVTCTASGYNPYTGYATIELDQTTTYDVSMDAPIMTVTPYTISEHVYPDTPEQIEITISNTEGSGELNWTAEVTQATSTLSLPKASDDFPRGTDELCAETIPEGLHPAYGSTTPELTLPKGSIGYGYETLPSGAFGFSMDTDSPDVLTALYNAPFETYAVEFGYESTDYMYSCNNDTYELTYLDINTGSYTTIGSLGMSNKLSDMAFDITTGIMYGLYGGHYICQVNLETGECIYVGDIGNDDGYMIAIAIDGSGNMWGHDSGLDEIWSIDKETAAGTSVGSTGFDANYAQSMDWDPISNTIYLAAFNNSNYYYELRAVDTSTGATTLLGGVYYAEVTAFSFPGDGTVPWITINPEFDAVPAGESSILTVTLNTVDYEIGDTLTCNIVIDTDPDVGTATIPVTVIVGEISTGEEPEEYETKLLGNFPNPMLNTTTFSFSIKEHSHVKLSVYNVRGQLVETILDEDVEPTASYNVMWNGTSNGKKLASGIYFYKLEAGSQSFLEKMILMR